MKTIIAILLIECIMVANIFSQTPEIDLARAKNLFEKATIFKQKSEIDSAIANYQTASLLYKKHEQWKNYLINEFYCAELLMIKGDFDKALLLFENIEATSISKLGNSNQILAGCYQSKGQIYFQKSDFNLSIDYFTKSLEIKKTMFGDSSIEVGNLYSDLGNVFSVMANFTSAQEYYNKSLEIKEKILGDQNPEIAITYNNLGIIHNNLGNYKQALEYLEKALYLQKQVYGEENLNVAEAYAGIGNVYIEKLEFEQAQSYVQKSIEIKKRILGDNHYKVAQDYAKLGIIAKGQGNMDLALQHYFLAADNIRVALNENHPDLAGLYNNIGEICRDQHNLNMALQYYQSALDIQLYHFGDFHPEVALIYNNMGVIYNMQNNNIKAIEQQGKALQIFESIFGTHHPKLVEPYINLATAYFENDETEQALEYYQKSIAANIPDFIPDSNYSNPPLINYYDQAKLLKSLKDKSKALLQLYLKTKNMQFLDLSIETVQLADTLIDRIRRTTIKKNDKILLGNLSAQVYENALYIFFEKIKTNNTPEIQNQAFYFSEKNKSSTLIEALSGAEAQKFSGIPDSLLDREKLLSQQIAYYEKQIAELTDPSNEDFYRNQLFEMNTMYNQLIKFFEDNYQNYFEMKYKPQAVTLVQMQTLLNPSTAVLSYFIGEENIFIQFITQNDFKFLSVKKNSEFESQIRVLHQVITSSKTQNIEKYKSISFSLYQLLFSFTIPDQTKQIILIPDGILGILPFEALLYENYEGDLKNFKEYPFLIKKYNFSYTYSANLYYKLLKTNDINKRPKNDWFGLAPVFAGENKVFINNTQVDDLPGSLTEVNTINAKFIEKNYITTCLTNTDANESKIKQTKLSDYKFIHIATHGFVNSELPELSGLILSRNPQTGDDGILFSGEIYNLELNADLVTLSACETGLGKITRGEGIIGLSRALLYAGARNIIVSLWKVSDASTTQLMIDFYDAVLNNSDGFKSQSSFSPMLYNAKIKMIESGKYAHPFFWSPFILIGQ